MKYGVDIPNYGPFADPLLVVEFAVLAESAGWDGFFIWDHLVRHEDASLPVVDPWIALAGAAAHTTRIRFGPMVTPLARRRPWVVARQSVSLDRLSGGRLVLGVGLGSRSQVEFGAFGDPAEPRTRAAVLDESLEILNGLWRGEPFEHHGGRYQIDETRFLPRPVQQPRIPVWVAGTWPHKRPFSRAARWDGAVPLPAAGGRLDMLTPEELGAVAEYIREQRGTLQGFDLVQMGITSGVDPERDAAILRPYVQAGATWWFENLDLTRDDLEGLRRRVLAGPPRTPEGDRG